MMATLMEKSTELRRKVREAREHLEPQGKPGEGIRRTLDVVLDYIEFMVTPEDDDEDSEGGEGKWGA